MSSTSQSSPKLNSPLQKSESKRLSIESQNILEGKRTKVSTDTYVGLKHPTRINTSSRCPSGDSTCIVCHEASFCADNFIVTCEHCLASFHQKCHTPHISNVVVKNANILWLCSGCYIKMQEESPAVDPVLCICGFQIEFDKMIECGACRNWQHINCIGFSSFDDLPKSYSCSICVSTENATKGLLALSKADSIARLSSVAFNDAKESQIVYTVGEESNQLIELTVLERQQQNDNLQSDQGVKLRSEHPEKIRGKNQDLSSSDEGEDLSLLQVAEICLADPLQYHYLSLLAKSSKEIERRKMSPSSCGYRYTIAAMLGNSRIQKMKMDSDKECGPIHYIENSPYSTPLLTHQNSTLSVVHDASQQNNMPSSLLPSSSSSMCSLPPTTNTPNHSVETSSYYSTISPRKKSQHNDYRKGNRSTLSPSKEPKYPHNPYYHHPTIVRQYSPANLSSSSINAYNPITHSSPITSSARTTTQTPNLPSSATSASSHSYPAVRPRNIRSL